MDDVDSEGIDSIAANIVSKDAGDEDLALVVVTEQAADHDGGGVVPSPEVSSWPANSLQLVECARTALLKKTESENMNNDVHQDDTGE